MKKKKLKGLVTKILNFVEGGEFKGMWKKMSWEGLKWKKKGKNGILVKVKGIFIKL